MYKKIMILGLLMGTIIVASCGKAGKYADAINLMQNEDYEAALNILQTIPSYEDSNNLIQECETNISLANDYATAKALFDNGDYIAAEKAYESLGEYSDCANMVKECQYQYAFSIFNVEKLSSIPEDERELAYEKLRNLGDYKDSSSLFYEKKYQYAKELSDKKAVQKASEIWLEISDYEDCKDLYTEYIQDWVLKVVKNRSLYKNIDDKIRQLDIILEKIPEDCDWAREVFFEMVYDDAEKYLEDGELFNSRSLFRYLSKNEYADSQNRFDEVAKLIKEEMDEIATQNAEAAASVGSTSTSGSSGGGAATGGSISINDIGVTYADRNNLSVTVNSFTRSDEGGYILYTVNYTVSNNNADTKILPGTFKIFYTDGTYENQYGGFDYLYNGDSETRTYSWKALSNQSLWVLEYNADDSDQGLNGAFFRTKPSNASLHWVVQ